PPGTQRQVIIVLVNGDTLGEKDENFFVVLSKPTNATITKGAGFCGIFNDDLLLSPSTLPDGSARVAYNQTITASGGTAPFTFALTSGTLPTGLTLSVSGVLSGTPTVAGSFTFTVTATDANGRKGSLV